MRAIYTNHTVKRRLTVSGTELYYEVYGDGIPIVMLHGWGVDHRLLLGCMEPIFKASQSNFRRIYLDLPGMGQSKAGKHVKNSDDVLEVILALLDTMLPEEQFLLVGESYGGYLARGLVKKRSQQILGLLLICPLMVPGYRKGEVPPLTVLERDDFFLKTLSAKERSYFEAITIVQNEEVWQRYKADLYEALLQHEDNHFLHDVLDGAFSYDIGQLEEPFTKPSLILTGRQDTEVGYQDQFQLLKNYSRATYVALDKAGHNLQIEQVRLFNCLVSEWLERVMKEKDKYM
ncbi:MAG TPA: alpha/beta hydrolase [Bacillota bacterium]|nr:alpha/beta hydrolase [Bacillota bacterium]HOL11216.1 alpha/beta hydrolase [Bacillota bacterium]HPO98346.1 alpha/beta hydrolase [Bacillota bacterium]